LGAAAGSIAGSFRRTERAWACHGGATLLQVEERLRLVREHERATMTSRPPRRRALDHDDRVTVGGDEIRSASARWLNVG
jgi:hypothetical protein